MSMRRILQGVAVMCACVITMMLGTVAMAFADTTMQATADVHVRSQPTTGSAVLGTLAKGQQIQTSGVTDGWDVVSYDGQTGYVDGDYLAPVQAAPASSPSTTGAGTVMYATANVFIRDYPLNSGNELGYLAKGSAITTFGLSGQWYIVNYANQTAYIYKDYLTTSASGVGTVMYATNGVWIRDTPLNSGNKLDVLMKGNAITTYGMSGQWYIVDHAGTKGYIYKNYLTETPTGGTGNVMNATTMYATANVYIHNAPLNSGAKLGVILKGASVSTYGTDNGWYIVDFSGTTGYVWGDYLSASPVA